MRKRKGTGSLILPSLHLHCPPAESELPLSTSGPATRHLSSLPFMVYPPHCCWRYRFGGERGRKSPLISCLKIPGVHWIKIQTPQGGIKHVSFLGLNPAQEPITLTSCIARSSLNCSSSCMSLWFRFRGSLHSELHLFDAYLSLSHTHLNVSICFCSSEL